MIRDFLAGNFLARDFLAHHVTFGDFMAGNFLAGDFLARDFLAHHVTFRDFMAGNFLAGDFLGWIHSNILFYAYFYKLELALLFSFYRDNIPYNIKRQN